ncbi:MAG: type II methionyl aminopeptidase [Candidatus Micrarchaeota archaeon]
MAGEEYEIEDNIDDFRAAGKLAGKIRDESKSLIMVGEPLLDIAETIEQMIEKEGARPAFPVNLSINDIAAHFTPTANDQRVLEEKDLLKVDIGVEINGAIGDTAYTVDLSGQHTQLVKAAEEALEAAIKAIKPGVKVGDIGGVVEDVGKKYGFKSIKNLSGHMIKTGLLHAGIDIPNVKTEDDYVLNEGEIFAVEPFMSTGAGYVVDGEEVGIFSFYGSGSVNMRQSRKLFDHIIREYKLLPFAERWIMKAFTSRLLVNAALKEMLEQQVIIGYPVLRDAEGGMVSQAEHTVLITTDGCEVLTK